jgi:hypothetical protein
LLRAILGYDSRTVNEPWPKLRAATVSNLLSLTEWEIPVHRADAKCPLAQRVFIANISAPQRQFGGPLAP